ncbi:hypothetical protein Tco_1171075, partial [Tanacetum coccineum]
RYFDVDLTVRKLVMNRLGQLLRNFRRKLRQTYILPNQDTPSKLNEVPAKYTAILKAEDWVNFVNYTATEEYKVKSAKAKMARKEKGGYARGVGSGVTYKRYFDLPQSKQAVDERILLPESQLDAARREHEEKELLIKSMSSKMSQGAVAVNANSIDTTRYSSTNAEQLLLDVIRMMRAFGRKCKKG